MRRLLNASFTERRELSKRAGHTGHRLVSSPLSYPVPIVVTQPTRWLPGWGRFSEELRTQAMPFVQPTARGIFTRDDQLVAWTGDRVLLMTEGSNWTGADTWAGTQQERGISCIIATADVARVTTPTESVLYSSITQGNTLRLSAIILAGGDLSLRLSSLVGDSVVSTTNYPGLGANRCKAVVLGGHMCLIYTVNGDNVVYMTYCEETRPGNWSVPISLMPNIPEEKDWTLAKRDDNLALLLGITNTSEVRATYLGPSGPVALPGVTANHLVSTGATPTSGIAAAINPDDHRIAIIHGIAPSGPNNSATRVFDEMLVPISPLSQVPSQAPLTATYKHVSASAGRPSFVVFGNRTVGPATEVLATEIDSVGVQSTITIPNAVVNGEAFTFGTIPQVPVRVGTEFATYPGRFYPSDMIFSVNEGRYRLVSSVSRGAAAGTALWPLNTTDFPPGQDTYVRARWNTQTASFISFSSGGQYESALSSVALNYLPTLVAAPAGRSTYLAGAIVQQWDGTKLTESGFVMPPMYSAPAVVASSGGNLGIGSYRYRVYAVKRNRWGEISRSPAFTSDVIPVVAASSKITLKVASYPATNDETAYFEVYRTEGEVNGDVYYLVSGQIPSTAVQNNRSALEISIEDVLPDSDIRVRLIDPHNPAPGIATELEESAPPGCSLVSNVSDRIWFAGGEVPSGSVAFSKLFEANEAVAWNDLGVLTYRPDRSVRPVTAIMPLENAIALFRDDAIFMVAGDGPDNLGNGSFAPSRRVPSDLGATTQNTTVTCPHGIAFWSYEGPRLLSNSLQVSNIGDDVATTSRVETAVSAVVIPNSTQIRFYRTNSDAVVWDYMNGEWSIFSNVTCNQAAYWTATRSACLAKDSGEVWIEDFSTFTDAGRPYEFLIRVAELHLEALVQGSSRARRWSLIGRLLGDHKLGITVFHDSSPLYSEKLEWAVAADVSPRVFGSGTSLLSGSTSVWYDGEGASSKDGVYRVRKRCSRQVCSAVSIEITDNFAPNGSFAIAELALELGIKPGNRRLPHRTFTNKY
jgi:hypothetical protein